jgi:acyl carrier protein
MTEFNDAPRVADDQLASQPVPSESVGAAVIAILARQALRAPEGVGPDDKLAALGIDSLGLAEAIFAIEERFDLAVPVDAVGADGPGHELATVGQVIAAVERLLTRPDPAT